MRGAYGLQKSKLSGRTAFIYGPLVLALDTAKNGGRDISGEISLVHDRSIYPYTLDTPCREHIELVCIDLYK